MSAIYGTNGSRGFNDVLGTSSSGTRATSTAALGPPQGASLETCVSGGVSGQNGARVDLTKGLSVLAVVAAAAAMVAAAAAAPRGLRITGGIYFSLLIRSSCHYDR